MKQVNSSKDIDYFNRQFFIKNYFFILNIYFDTHAVFSLLN